MLEVLAFIKPRVQTCDAHLYRDWTAGQPFFHLAGKSEECAKQALHTSLSPEFEERNFGSP